jgi:hypothetical protein
MILTTLHLLLDHEHLLWLQAECLETPGVVVGQLLLCLRTIKLRMGLKYRVASDDAVGKLLHGGLTAQRVTLDVLWVSDPEQIAVAGVEQLVGQGGRVAVDGDTCAADAPWEVLLVSPHAGLAEERARPHCVLAALEVARWLRGGARDRAHRPDRKGEVLAQRSSAQPALPVPHRVAELLRVHRPELRLAIHVGYEVRDGVPFITEREAREATGDGKVRYSLVQLSHDLSMRSKKALAKANSE